MIYPGEEIKSLKKEVQIWKDLTKSWQTIAKDLITDLEYHREAQKGIKDALEEFDYLK